MLIPIKKRIIWHDSLDSSSMEIHRMLNKECKGHSCGILHDMTVVASGYQTAGRGQGEHSWHSETGKNLLFSIFRSYRATGDFPAADQQLLTMAASLAVCDFLQSYGITAMIKQPNDIYVGNKKICGMLIENSLESGKMRWSIVGMGINVNQTTFPEDIPNPVSMSVLTGREYDIKKCLREFLKHFSARFDAIWTESERLVEEYHCKLLTEAFIKSIAAAGSSAANTAEPATKISAPASDRA